MPRCLPCSRCLAGSAPASPIASSQNGFRAHQLLYEDGVDVPKHKLTGIKRPKTAHQHLKTKPRYPLTDLFLHSQAVAPLDPKV